ncbi:RagB/SusD family nutrient uptake outer membrane protein [Sphingobacterium anhuiense]|uniref:RagB/SusD family nutrient uptake outer membrane protein n=1 Tax=Sphingobacterium anhuiense TaxID=493780 RepID=A0ABW5YWW6_9SPHI
MKKYLYIATLSLTLTSCHKLDLNPLSEATNENFYRNQTELELAVNDLYRSDFWGKDNELYSDNEWHRAQLTNAVIGGTMNSEDSGVRTYWLVSYKAIARVNSFMKNKDKAVDNTAASVISRLTAEMQVIRAYQYAKLITHFGDVPFIEGVLTLEESYGKDRTDKTKIMEFVFKELDEAAAILPESYGSGSVQRLTKGAALAIKARLALYMEQWTVAKEASAQVIALADKGIYQLNTNFGAVFTKQGSLTKEMIFCIPRSEVDKVSNGAAYVQDYISRNAGGFGAWLPTRDLVDAFETTEGKPIDESATYNPQNPFANRDPRLAATVVPFNTQWLGYNYSPHPDSLTVHSSKFGRQVSNKDSRAVAAFASYTGFLWKKGIDQSWADRLVEDSDVIVFRYPEILLTYAEAKVQLGEADESVLKAINTIRARAYQKSVENITDYPAIKTLNVVELTKIIRRERRVEFAKEGLRYMDLIRWRLAEFALTKPVIGLPDPAKQDRSKWPFPGVTPIDDMGIADYSGFGSHVKNLIERKFDKSKQYLWPIPAVEIRINPNIKQNPNY